MFDGPGLIADDIQQKQANASDDVGLFQDIPRAIWIMFLSSWFILFGLFILFFASDASAAFAVVIASLFAMMAFGLPIALAAQSWRPGHECHGSIQTHTGRLSVWEAGAQIVSIPVAAVIGLSAFIIFVR